MEAHQAAIVEIPEQSDRTGSSGYQVPNQAHARLQELRLRRHHNRRRRTAPPYSQRSICPASPTPQRASCPCDLECSPCYINHCLSSRLNVHTSIIAPEPAYTVSPYDNGAKHSLTSEAGYLREQRPLRDTSTHWRSGHASQGGVPSWGTSKAVWLRER